VGEVTRLDFRDQNILVEAGQHLAIVLSSAVDGMWWRGSNSDPYSEGGAYWHTQNDDSWVAQPNVDLYFQTTVCPYPTPVESTGWGRVKASYRE
jgi:hypothetical protein